jgi:glutamate 5-kinase
VERFVSEVRLLIEKGEKVVLVSSGAIACARGEFQDSFSMPVLQALSAIGQPILIKEYQNAFADIRVAQLLVTREDFENRARFLNIRNTVRELLSLGVVPIFNENDTTSFEEISLGDNDQLAALVGIAVDARVVIFLTSTDGLYDRDPGLPDAKKIEVVEFDESLEIQFGKKSNLGRGGMKSKIAAVQKLVSNGIPARIASHALSPMLEPIFSNKAGTYFLANSKKTSLKKAWLAGVRLSKGRIKVDSGAVKALFNGSSLLAKGITAVNGNFSRADLVEVEGEDGKIIGRGLSEYSSVEISRIKGLHSSEISKFILVFHGESVIHRDNFDLEKK